jgi:3-carboxy-cis,cis-muconate cycloisomerase
MSVPLIDSLATTEALSALFTDESLVRAMLDFEVALAAVEARAGLIPDGTAEAITEAAHSLDFAGLARDALRAGTPAIPLVKMLSRHTRFAHWGATSQDVSDTALVLLLKRAQAFLHQDYVRLEGALYRISEEHANTVMLGRTLLQPAPPVTFGLKAAGWYAAVRRGAARVSSRFDEALVLQFGGASGTLAALGEHGVEIGQALAEELGLKYPDAPWHAYRDRLAALLCACGVMVGSLGKMARDVSLLMQGEVGEAAEPGGEGRGGSSTMPHKQNPIACAITLAAANRAPAFVAAFLSGMVQEHERGIGGWHAEWPTIAGMMQTTGAAIRAMAEVAEGLTVDAGRMRQNIEAVQGAIFAEKALLRLAPTLGRDRAHALIEEASRRSRREKRRLGEVLAEMPEAASLGEIEAPEAYLGSAAEFRKRLLDTGRG